MPMNEAYECAVSQAFEAACQKRDAIESPFACPDYLPDPFKATILFLEKLHATNFKINLVWDLTKNPKNFEDQQNIRATVVVTPSEATPRKAFTFYMWVSDEGTKAVLSPEIDDDAREFNADDPKAFGEFLAKISDFVVTPPLQVVVPFELPENSRL